LDRIHKRLQLAPSASRIQEHQKKPSVKSNSGYFAFEMCPKPEIYKNYFYSR